MTAYCDIRAALEAKLAAFALLPPTYQVAWEGIPFTPPATGVWLRSVQIPARTTQLTLGVDALDLHTGVYQVSVMVGPGVGLGGALATADAVVGHFKRNTKLVSGSTTVVIETSSRGPAFPDGSWLNIPISIDYRAVL